MAKGFGKIKRLIGKKDKKVVTDEKENIATPSSTPTRNADVLSPSVVHLVTSTDATERIKQPNRHHHPAASEREGDQVPLLSGSQTGADDVLDGILQDLNIKVGQLAVNAERTDTVSEYSGGSAKSVESTSSEESETDEDDEEETDEDDEEETDEEDQGEEVVRQATPRNASSAMNRNSVDNRVAAVVAAAEEIQKKRVGGGANHGHGASRPPIHPAPEASRASGKTTPGTVPSADNRSASVATEKCREQASRAGSREASRASSKEASRGASKETSRGGSTKPSKPVGSNKPNKQTGGSSKSVKSRRSPIKDMIRPGSRSNAKAPQFSPEIKSNGNHKAASAPHHPKKNRSFDSRDDCDHTKDTMEASDEDDDDTRTYDDTLGSKGEDDTLGENTLGENTLGENTLGTDGESYEGGRRRDVSMSESQNGESTFDEEEERIKTKKTVMNKDIIIHQPGGPSSLVVRAMYYTPLPASPEDIIIKVEASTVSFRDCLLRRDIGIDKVAFPFVPGSEVVGRISNIGKAARQQGYRVGDRVVGMTRKGGGNGYYAKFTTRSVAPVISTSIDAADAVCLVDVYMTAYQALRVGKKDGTPLTDANVLITDGFSPVGQAAVALAKLEGANVYVTTTESRQDEYMKTLGVKCLPLAPSKWLHKLKGKMDIVIDNTCFDSYDSSWKALNANGLLVCTGMTSIYSFQDHGAGGSGCCDAFGDVRDYQAKWASLKARYMMSQTKFHDLWESFQNDPKKYHQELKYLCFLVESGSLKPKIAERVSIEEIPDAQRYLETGKANGTIVCLP